ncbi:MAG: ImmA/IrrE family metallo-endopeptidase [Chloroflexota bacterium]
MAQPSLDFLCDCIAFALLDYYAVDKAPVPVREMLASPPPDLAGDICLSPGLPFGDALWLRLLRGQGTVFVNNALSEVEQRYAMARSLFTGLCDSKGGRAVGLPAVPNDRLRAQGASFARRLLMPEPLLPAEAASMSPQELADLFVVPLRVAEERLQELA